MKEYISIEEPYYKNYISMTNGENIVSIELVELYINGFLEIQIEDIESILDK